MDLNTVKKAHFIGIGGIGISAIARMFLLEGKAVSGSDQAVSPVTTELAALGVDVKFGQTATNIPDGVDLVIYTIAIPADNPELSEARRRGIPVKSYPEILGLISADKFTIAVSGTHGKTTTTAMIAKIFIDAGLDPTVIVGSFLNGYKSNFIASSTPLGVNGRKYLIVEACEYRRSFLNLKPKILVITNIDNDHLDYYKDLDDIKSAFAELTAKLPADGVLITEKEYGQIARNFKLKVPGEHNLKNAQAALAVAQVVGIDPAAARASLSHFAGTWRRFEFKGKTRAGALVYDDYGHHPSEIKATLSGAREILPAGKIYVAFQPHLYSRTKLLFADFAAAFKAADQVYLLPIYAAREPVDPSVTSSELATAITQHGTSAIALQNFDQAVERLAAAAGPGDLILTIGAGDVFKIAEKLV